MSDILKALIAENQTGVQRADARSLSPVVLLELFWEVVR